MRERRLREGKRKIHTGDPSGAGLSDGTDEFLDMKYEPAALRELYLYMHRELAGAIISVSEDRLAQPESILTRLRDAYLELEKTGSFEPVMDNTQQIYAGLTYGKNSLVESLAQPVSNRGFLA